LSISPCINSNLRILLIPRKGISMYDMIGTISIDDVNRANEKAQSLRSLSGKLQDLLRDELYGLQSKGVTISNQQIKDLVRSIVMRTFEGSLR
jgi:hypothetical protein